MGPARAATWFAPIANLLGWVTLIGADLVECGATTAAAASSGGAMTIEETMHKAAAVLGAV